MANLALFGTLAASLFTDPALSESATYNGQPVRLIRKAASADFRFEGTTIRADAATFKVPADAVLSPAEGDTITDADGNSYTVQGAPSRIMRGAAWLVEAVPT